VFGSYLDSEAGYLGDLDLAVSAIRRESDRDLYVRKVLAYARASGRRFDAFHELLYWPARELRMFLKNRSPAIRITGEDVCQFTDRFEIIYAVSEDPDADPGATECDGRALTSDAWVPGRASRRAGSAVIVIAALLLDVGSCPPVRARCFRWRRRWG